MALVPYSNISSQYVTGRSGSGAHLMGITRNAFRWCTLVPQAASKFVLQRSGKL